ncbi:MYND finger protein, putative [Plasmodium relictum]|uniref:MYND finger protein, putative n=1 Tax=Plasmodium relictum TaxID=85471 RepID=A0A1J1H822_PLARL|nr:MYND finger protein, putative [Plasmodium relictum]CRH01112.1 MYND finger protein, putative [Plasmodium relictum]
MAENILKSVHSDFKYVLISCDINNEVKELSFKGSEEKFQNTLASYFRRIIFDEKGKNELKETIKEKLENNKDNKEKKEKEDLNKISPDIINNAIETSQTYQIIPLTLPTEENNYFAVNCYIDDVGRIKQLPYNSRASRICNTDIYGDAFLSKTYDNEDFKRCDFTIKEYEEFLKNPPKSANRWDQAQAMQDLLSQMKSKKDGDNVSMPNTKTNACEHCYKEKNLKRCGKCKKVYYCSVECQKNDFVFHKRICS